MILIICSLFYESLTNKRITFNIQTLIANGVTGFGENAKETMVQHVEPESELMKELKRLRLQMVETYAMAIKQEKLHVTYIVIVKV